MQDFKPGDVIIEECILHSLDGSRQYNIGLQARLIDIYESVLQPIIYGELVIADGIGLLKGFPINGEEYITLRFTTPTFNTLEYKLNIFAVEDIQQVEGNRMTMYTLKLCSPEAMDNAVRLVTKRFKGQISDTVKRLLSDELRTQKKLTVEDSQGIDEHLITNMTPLQAIDKFRHRAVSSKNQSSSYLFFENAAGFHFITLEELIKNGKKQKIDKVYFYDDNIDLNQEQVRFRDIISYEQLQSQNTIDKLQAGAQKNVVNKFDLLTGNITKVEFESEQFEDTFARTADTPKNNSSKFNEKYGKTSARSFLVPFSSEHDDSYIGDKVGKLHSFIDKITQNLMQLHVYGDTSLTIGQVINCNFSAGNALSKEREIKQVSTNYLVTKIRHMIQIADRPFYTQSIECLNNSHDY